MATIPPTMKALRIDRFGGPDVAKLADIDVPRPGDGEILLRIRAASVNPVDYKIREGKFPPVADSMLPYTLGRDASGEVVACGKGVESFREGDLVHAYFGTDRGGYAEYVILKPDEAAPKPKSLDHEKAAAVPLAGLTAWQGLFQHGGLKAGQRVLIHAGSGGVGHFAVQFAKARGAHVITTVSSDSVEFARRLGADEVIDYKQQKFEQEAGSVDLVYDLIGGDTQEKSWNLIKRGGALVSTVQEPSAERAKSLGIRAMRYMAQPSGAELREIGELLDAGKVKPFVSKTFDLGEALAALAAVEAGHSVGKVVLTMV